MAWPKDKTKPYDPYAPGTPTVKAQDRMNLAASRAVAPVVDTARNVSRALGGNVTGAVLGRLSADASARSANANVVASTQANRAAREGLGKRFPDGRMVIDQRPVTQTLSQPPTMGVQRDGIQSRRIDPATQQGFKSAMTATQQIGGNIPEARKGLIDQYSGRGSVQRPSPNTFSGTQQVGNMDVTFDKSTPLAARKAFMQNPVAPTGQNIQYQKYMNTPRGQNFGVQKIADNTPAPLNTFGDVMREKARRSLLRDQSAIATAEDGLVIDADRNRISEEGNAMNYGLGLDRNNIDVRGQDIDARGQDLLARSAAERNRIDAMTAEANSQTAQIDAEGKNLEIQDKLRKSGLEQKYYDPKTPEDERRRIEALLGIKNKPEFFTDQGVTPDGMPTKETYIYENGQARRAAPGGDTPPLTRGATAAMEDMKAGKLTREQFLTIYPQYASYLGQ